MPHLRPGKGMFFHAAAAMSSGSSAPTILPVWEMERLYARSPPRVTCVHHELDDPPPIRRRPKSHCHRDGKCIVFRTHLKQEVLLACLKVGTSEVMEN